MAIYGRFGGEVRVLRMGTLEDVTALDKRKPDKVDREAVRNGSYVVVEFTDDKPRERKQQLYHLAYLRADGALPEIMAAVRAAGGEG